MFKIFNRMAWVISIIVGISIFAIDDDLFFFGLIAIFVIKWVLSENFIKQNIISYNRKLEESIKDSIKETFGYTENNDSIEKEITDTKESIVEDILKQSVNEQKEELQSVNTTENLNTEDFKEEYKEKNVVDDLINKANEIQGKATEKINKKSSKIKLFLKEFFAENLIAKIGGILLALGIIFFMGLIYSQIGEVAKIIIGFAVGFGIYFTGNVVLKKGLKTEASILFGIGILINYIVILAGKFIIGDNTNGFLSGGITFLLLILNTAFSIVTSFVYKYKNLLLFSVIFAFLIPFLIDDKLDAYIQLGYGLILGLGGLIISNYFKDNKSISASKELFFISLIGSNILFSTTQFGKDTTIFVSILIAFNIINFLSLFLAYKNKFEKEILFSFIISFLFLALIMFSGSALTGVGILISFIISTIGLFVGICFFIIMGIGTGLIYLLFLPLIFVLAFIFIGGAGVGIILLPLFLLVYLAGFAFGIGGFLTGIFKYIFFGILGVFLTFGNIYINTSIEITLLSFIILAITGFLFIFSSYYLSNNENTGYFYSIGTLFGIFILLPILQLSGELVFYSVLCIILFGIINYITPFINKKLVEKNISNIVIGNTLGILFIGGNLFRYGQEYFPGVTLGLSFLVLAIIYFIGGYIIFNKLNLNRKDLEKTEEDKVINSKLDFIYTYLAIALALFSISIAVIFADSQAIITILWLLQSSIILFFANKLNKEKVYYAGIILFIAGLIKFLNYFWFISRTIMFKLEDVVINNLPIEIEYVGFIVGLTFIGAFIFLNLYIFKKTKFKSILAINILHIISTFIFILSYILVISVLLVDKLGYLFLLKNSIQMRSFVSILILVSFVSILILVIIYNLYEIFGNNATKWFSYIIFIISFMIQIGIVSSSDINYELYYLNYFYTISVLLLHIQQNYFKKSLGNQDNTTIYTFFEVSIYIYLFIITSMYIFNIINDVFILTIYWGILSFVFIHAGINKKYSNLRRIGLYLLVITLIKIVFMDIWDNLNDPLLRVFALMLVGGIMIYISSLYSKNNLKIGNDFLFRNFGDSDLKSGQDENKKGNDEILSKKYEEQKSYIINQVIKDIDVSNIKSIKFNIKNGRSFSIKSKNLFKIIKLVIQKLGGKTTFEAGELDKIYYDIINNYKTEINEADYNKLISIIKEFVDKGGSVEIKE